MTYDAPLNREQRRALEREERREADRKRRRLRAAGASSAAVTMAGLLVSAATPAAAAATTYVVNDPADYPPGTPHNTTTLRDAIEAANNNPGADTVTFNSALMDQTIQLLSQIGITDPVDIQGLGRDHLTIRNTGRYDASYQAGNNYSNHMVYDRIFYIHSVATPQINVSISQLTMRDGNTTQSGIPTDRRGGAILDIGENLALTDIRLDQNRAHGDGGAVFVDPESGAQIGLVRTLVTGNTASNRTNNYNYYSNGNASGGGVSVSSDYPSDTATATISVQGSNFTNDRTDLNGGGLNVSNVDGSVSVASSQFTNNGIFGIGNKNGHGGGLNIDGDTANDAQTMAVTIAGTLVNDNDSGTGAGMNLRNLDTLAVTNGTVTGNNGAPYGFPYNSGGGADIEHVVSGTVDKTAFRDNRAGYGGGLAVYDSAIDLSNLTMTGNSSPRDGGALYADGGTVNLATSTISGNSAGGDGGGIHLYGTTSAISDTTLDRNAAQNDGGGAYLYNSTATLTGSTISGNTGDSGGGVYTKYGSVDLTDTTVSDNIARYNGGGLALYYSQSTLDNVTVSHNAANGSEGNGDGGGILAKSRSNNVSRSTNAQRHKAKPAQPKTKADRSHKPHQHAKAPRPAAADQPYGLVITGSTIENNTARYSGGGLDLYGSAGITDTTVSGNAATNNDGGGARLHNGTFKLTNTTLSGNTASSEGGGIYAHYADVALYSGTVSGNTADSDGGGLYARYANVSTFDSTISDNTTPGDGGGMSFDRGVTADIERTSITGNSADGNGGGINSYYSGGDITASTISGNAAQGDGGGIRATSESGYSGHTLNVGTTTIDGNTATGDGGGVYLNYMSMPITQSTISNNTATGEGGGVYERRSTVPFVNSTVSGNNAGSDGGGVAIVDGATSFNVTTVVDNTSGGSGDGLYYNGSNSNIPIRNSIVANNGEDLGPAGGYGGTGYGYGGSRYRVTWSLIENPNGQDLGDPAVTHNIIGVDPALGALANNGGPTKTHLPSSGSPAIDAGDPAYAAGESSSTPNQDQRLLPRPVRIVDMGSVEVQNFVAPPPPPPPETSPSPSPSPSPTVSPSAPSQTATGRYVALQTPTRVLDSRNGTGTTTGLKTGAVTLDLSSQVPAGATGVILNVTITAPDHAGHVVVYPSGAPLPPTSNVNFTTGQTQANEVFARLSSDRKVTLDVHGANTHLVGDLVGYFSSSAGDDVQTQAATRVFDSRDAGGDGNVSGDVTLDLTGKIPAGTTSAVLNVTVTHPDHSGFVTVFPAGTALPGTSNVNFIPGQTQANEVFTRVGTGANAGKVTFHVDSANAALIVDLVGTAGSATANTVTAIQPVRAMDTRDGTGGHTGRVNGEVTLTLPSDVPAGATGVVLNVTTVGGSVPGFVTVYPFGATRPNTSNVNFVVGSIQANEALTGISADHKVTLFVGGAHSPLVHLVVDVVGYLHP
ncbi:MAG: putative extracellular nuclease [Frankiales bacterium]|nr:putative extracellular nuclease [Frankiales bacterium]